MLRGARRSSRDVWPSSSRRFLMLAGLTGFAISQPLLSVLGDDPTTLAFHGVRGGQLARLAVPDRVRPAARPLGGQSPVADARRPPRRARPAPGRRGRARRLRRRAGRQERGDRAADRAGHRGARRRRRVRRSPTSGRAPWRTWATYTAILPSSPWGSSCSPRPRPRSSARPRRALTAVGGAGGGPAVRSSSSCSTSSRPGRSSTTPARSTRVASRTWPPSRIRPPGIGITPPLSRRHGSRPCPRCSPVSSRRRTRRCGRATRTIPLHACSRPTHELEVLETVTTLCPYDERASPTTTDERRHPAGDRRPVRRTSVTSSTSRPTSGSSGCRPVRPAPSALDDFAEEPEAPREFEPASVPSDLDEDVRCGFER